MTKRDFHTWLSNFRYSIADFGYYIDFKKVYKNVDSIKIELNILNSLIGSKNIESDFEKLIAKYPEILKCIPILLAVREYEIFAGENGDVKFYTFDKQINTVEEYKLFMKKTGLFDLLSNHIINNLYDYVTGVETGLDSNGRKNRGGHQMEDLVESYIQKAGFNRDVNYFKEMYVSEVSRKWNIDLSAVSNQGKMEKRWDFVVKTDNCIYLIETNFYGSGGSKLNETARSYKTIATEMKNVKGAKFVWFTDGAGWKSAARNLEETFDVLDDIYSINDMQNGIMKELFK
ncbi:type II restriction endonuclease [Treponema porcinum]|uniref:type II restriction endonuclease n=1 Tax=Treponema porcinum TaxID=261392 RepID=UPI002A833870|nr:type II restriction endonuclease [Treponema porcinum]MDD7697960.1 type II restriction endonuclease [Spirochaetia bacterium]MDY4467376.1 type II restriction endonuclease [Treponema porcinum]